MTLRYSLSECYEMAKALMESLEKSECSGLDKYFSHKSYHPMAEALLIQSRKVLLSTKLLSQSKSKVRNKESLERLKDSLLTNDGRYGWGLGFPWKYGSDQTVYTITTALVIEALLSQEEDVTDILTSTEKYFLSEKMIHRHTSGRNVGYPVFAEEFPRPILNAGAYICASFLSWKGCDKQWKKVMDSVLKHASRLYVPKIGWRYEQESNVIDLLHQMYILKSMRSMGIKIDHTQLLLILDSFETSMGYSDRIDIVDNVDKLFLPQNKNMRCLKKIDNSMESVIEDYRTVHKCKDWIKRLLQRMVRSQEYAITDYRSARPWTYGMVLAVISDEIVFCTQPVKNALHLRLKKIVRIVLDEIHQTGYDNFPPRIQAHLLLGLCSYLRYIRMK